MYQRTAQWVFPNPNYHRAVPDGERWAIRHLPFFGRWFRFLTFYPGAGLSVERNRIDPEWDDGGHSVSAANAATRELFAALMLAQLGDDEELDGEGAARLPADRQAHAAGQRLVAGVPAQGQRRARAHRHRAHRRRRRDHRRRHVPSRRHHLLRHRLPAQRLPLADAHRRARRRGAARASGGSSRRRTSASPSSSFPNLFCLYGPGTNLAHGASLIYQSENQVDYVMQALHELLTSGHRALEPRAEVQDEYTARYSERDLADGVGARVGEALALQEPRGARSSPSRRGPSPPTGRGRRPSSRRTTSGCDGFVRGPDGHSSAMTDAPDPQTAISPTPTSTATSRPTRAERSPPRSRRQRRDELLTPADETGEG